MADLNEQVHIEDHTLLAEGQDPSTIEEVGFQHSNTLLYHPN